MNLLEIVYLSFILFFIGELFPYRYMPNLNIIEAVGYGGVITMKIYYIQGIILPIYIVTSIINSIWYAPFLNLLIAFFCGGLLFKFLFKSKILTQLRENPTPSKFIFNGIGLIVIDILLLLKIF